MKPSPDLCRKINALLNWREFSCKLYLKLEDERVYRVHQVYPSTHTGMLKLEVSLYTFDREYLEVDYANTRFTFFFE